MDGHQSNGFLILRILLIWFLIYTWETIKIVEPQWDRKSSVCLCVLLVHVFAQVFWLIKLTLDQTTCVIFIVIPFSSVTFVPFFKPCKRTKDCGHTSRLVTKRVTRTHNATATLLFPHGGHFVAPHVSLERVGRAAPTMRLHLLLLAPADC